MMTPENEILREAPADAFWLSDGTLMGMEAWKEGQVSGKYWGAAGVNAAHCGFWHTLKGGSVGDGWHNKFNVQEAVLMAILCSAEGAAAIPREHIIITTNDNSEGQIIHQQVQKRWTDEEFTRGGARLECRLPILAHIRQQFYDLLVNHGVKKIILTNNDTLIAWRPDLCAKYKEYYGKPAEWVPHWRAQDVCRLCFLSQTEHSLFADSMVWDYRYILPEQATLFPTVFPTVSAAMVIQPWFLAPHGHGYSITLKLPCIPLV